MIAKRDHHVRIVDLPDGSVCEIDHDGSAMSMISRLVDGDCVWGQVFSSYREDHPAQVQRVVDSMTANPAGFDRRLLWDVNGRAVTA